MDEVLISSGCYPAVLEALRPRFQPRYLPDQREALRSLEQPGPRPLAVRIGNYVGPPGDLSAAEMLAAVQSLDPELPVIISTHQDAPAAIVELVKAGAFDYVVEPDAPEGDPAWDDYSQRLLHVLERACQYRRLWLENERLRLALLAEDGGDELVGRDPGMLRALELVAKVAPTDATVLLSGESGTGKELVARALHARSPRRAEAFLAVNCAALSPTLLTSELFGHVRGAFTGADRDRPGMIARAGGGTLFLDEMASVPPEFQALLLRVLEERLARPVGGASDYPVHCRFIAAANRELDELVRRGEFREDLYYRLAAFHIELPPLRARADDVTVLAQHFCDRAAERYGKAVRGIDAAAMRVLESCPWPGNVRQLKNAVERAVIVCERERVGVGDLDPRIRAGGRDARDPDIGGSYQQAMRAFERRLIGEACRRAAGNLSAAARALQMKRSTLHYRLKQLQLDRHGGEAEGS